MNELKAVLLVGGEATRLYPLSKNSPKGLLPIRELPIIEYMFKKFIDVGVDDFILIAASKHREQWEAYKKMSEYKIEIFYEETKYDTAGFICNNINLFPDKFICANGDLLMDLNLDNFIESVFTSRTSILSTIQVTNPSRFGLVIYDEKNIVKKFIEKPKDVTLGNTISTGLYFLQLKDLARFDFKDNVQISFEKDIFPFLANLSLLSNCSLSGRLFDVGTRESYIEANCMSENYWIHPTAIFHKTVEIKKSVIMKNSQIGQNAVIVNSIIGPNIKLEANSIIEDEIFC